MSGNSSQPLISVIIPAYNHENYITDTINSLINQTYENIELIVINDGSTDNTSKVIEIYYQNVKNVLPMLNI